ncbi:MAG: hypothetical protein CL543_03560 [Alcanivorax sp.]|jgi:hypothetical protein|nr:hypothetical protein [Alcanivorax sp.]MAY10558.1 hypothetical protein [Alcanivorax sp.]MBI53436.1 hypothetical protein [Alcanivorax sp.]MBU57930.1 hypothetical protein [Alcanivorax sp.]
MRLLFVIIMAVVAFPAQGSDSKAKVASLVEKMMTNAYAYGVCDALEALEEFDRGNSDLVADEFLSGFLLEEDFGSQIPGADLVSGCRSARQKHDTAKALFQSKGEKMATQFDALTGRSYKAGFCKVAVGLDGFSENSGNANEMEFAEGFSNATLKDVLEEGDQSSHDALCFGYLLKYASDKSEIKSESE